MKILYTIAKADFYGSERHVFDLIRFNSVQNDVMLIAFSDGILVSKVRALGVEVCVLNENKWVFDFKSIKKVYNVIRGFAPNLIHSHQPRAIFWCSLISKLIGVKHISTIHSTAIQHSRNYKGVKAGLVWLFQEIVRCVAEALSSKSLFVSSTSSRRAFFPSKSVVVHNWVSPEFDNKVNLRQAKRGHLLCVSSLARPKGILELLELFSKYLLLCPSAHLEIIGDGSDVFKIEIQKTIVNFSLKDKVTLSGYSQSLIEKYLTSDAFVSLTHDETFGLVFVEAMACGMPVICSDLLILREVVPSWNCFVERSEVHDNAIVQKIVEFANDANSVSARNAEWVRMHFDAKRNMEQIFSVYKLVSK